MTRVKIPLDRGPVLLATTAGGEVRITLLNGKHGGACLLVESELPLLWSPEGRVEPRRPRRIARKATVD